MKKKLAAVMLSLALIAGLIPGMALAAGDESGEQGEKSNLVYVSQDGTGDGKTVQTPAALSSELVEKQDMPSVFVLTGDISLEQTVVIPADKEITLTDGGTPVSLSVKAGAKVDEMFRVESGGTLAIQTSTKGQDSLLVLDGGSLAPNSGSQRRGEHATVYGTFRLEGGTLQGAEVHAAHSGSVAAVGETASVQINGGIITGTYIDNQFSGAVYISEGASLVMAGGKITDTAANPGQMNNAAVYLEASGGNPSFSMSGGEISKTSAYYGGVFVGSMYPDYTSEAAFTMTGGLIAQNHASFCGGGVAVIASGSFYFNGGAISGNQAPIGGGVAAYDLFKKAAEQAGFDIQDWSTVYHCPARFEMAGGTITGNRAVFDEEQDYGCGGGVYVASNTCSIRGGTISGNLADRQGGGIYVGSTPYTLHMSDTLVTENSATVLGGGIWLCPTGDVVNTVTNGGAVFGNDAAAPDGGMAAGDDLVAVPQEEKAHQVSLADRLLGGGEVAWYVDGGVKSTQPELGNVLGEPDGTPRFDAEDPGERQTGIDGCTDGLSLKAVASDSAARLAASRAQVVVTGNSAPRGGGIGSNGAIVIGTEEEEWRLVVTKAWDHVEESGRKPVTVRLKIGDYALDAVTLSEENGWMAEFTQLPNPDTLGELSITVVEEGNEYQAAYSEVAKDEQSKILSVTVTNSPAPRPETGDLVIAKTVTGDGGDQSEDFSFQVVLTQPLTGLYGDLSFADGAAQFSLRHGQSVTACGLPAGVGYTVVEQQANENGYTTSSTGEQGTIRKDAVQRADFINHREGQVPPQEEPQQPDHPDSQVPPTGDAAGSAPCLLGMTAAGIAAAVILYGKKRKKRTE